MDETKTEKETTNGPINGNDEAAGTIRRSGGLWPLTDTAAAQEEPSQKTPLPVDPSVRHAAFGAL